MSKTIEDLQKKLALIEKNTRPVKSESSSAHTVTILSRHKCDYKAGGVYEFDAHRWGTSYKCSYCGGQRNIGRNSKSLLIVIFAAKVFNEKLMSWYTKNRILRKMLPLVGNSSQVIVILW